MELRLIKTVDLERGKKIRKVHKGNQLFIMEEVRSYFVFELEGRQIGTKTKTEEQARNTIEQTLTSKIAA